VEQDAGNAGLGKPTPTYPQSLPPYKHIGQKAQGNDTKAETQRGRG